MQTSSVMLSVVVNYTADASEYLEFPFGKITIGRNPINSICLYADFISRIHAVIFIDWKGRLKIRDGALFGKRSTHGLYLDNCRIWESEITKGETISFSQKHEFPNIEITKITATNAEEKTANFTPKGV